MKIRTVFILSVAVLALFCGAAAPAWASPGGRAKRNPDFQLPKGLADRVGFWVDVFTRFGKDQLIIHHRNYPWVVFSVLDFKSQAEILPPVELAKYKKDAEKKEIEAIREIMTLLAGGSPPQNSLDAVVANKMRSVPGGSAKFKEVLDNDLIRTQTGIREKFGDAIKRSGRYMESMERIFAEEYGLPIELTRLPFVESSFDYTANSSVGAAGIWQFMPKTGRLYMQVNQVVDERRDPIESTRAAAQFLKDAYQRFSSWPLAITSYNHGAGGVAKKVDKMGTPDIVKLVETTGDPLFGFASNNFFAEFLAALEVYENHELYFPEVEPEDPLRMTSAPLKNPATVQFLSQSLGIDLDTLKLYNPAATDKVWKGLYPLPRGYRLKVPMEFGRKAVEFDGVDPRVKKTEMAASSIYGGTQYQVRKGDSSASIAKKYRTSTVELRRLNDLKSDAVKVGQVLVVRAPGGGEAAKPAVSKSKASPPSKKPAAKTKAPAPQAKPRSYKVKPGDTLGEIADKFSLRMSQLQSANGLKDSSVRPGQILRIP